MIRDFLLGLTNLSFKRSQNDNGHENPQWPWKGKRASDELKLISRLYPQVKMI
jgi:hypothetical protein